MAARLKASASKSLTEITLKVRPKATLPQIQRDLGSILGRLGCPGCMSGLDRIVINNSRLRGGM